MSRQAKLAVSLALVLVCACVGANNSLPQAAQRLEPVVERAAGAWERAALDLIVALQQSLVELVLSVTASTKGLL